MCELHHLTEYVVPPKFFFLQGELNVRAMSMENVNTRNFQVHLEDIYVPDTY